MDNDGIWLFMTKTLLQLQKYVLLMDKKTSKAQIIKCICDWNVVNCSTLNELKNTIQVHMENKPMINPDGKEYIVHEISVCN